MEPTLMTDAHGNSFWVTKTFMQPEINLDPASDPLALDVKPKPEPSSVKLEPGTEPDPLDTSINNVMQLETSLESSSLNPASDPLALEVKPKPVVFSVKLEPGIESDIPPLDTSMNNVTQFESTEVKKETDLLDITDNIVPKMESTSESTTVPSESTITTSPLALNSSTPQARSIEPSAMNATTEPPSDMQDSLPQGILPGSRSAEDQSSSVFNEASQPAVARSDSTDNQVFDSVSRSDCVDSEPRDDDSMQLTSDTSLAVKYNLKQCSVSLRRVSSTHTAPGIVSDRSPFQTSDKETPSTSNDIRCKVCLREFSDYWARYSHQQKYSKRHFACDKCRKFFLKKSDLKEHGLRHLKNFSCKLCSREFSSYNSWYTHDRNFDKLHFACEKCPKFFDKKSDLEKHGVRHLDVYSCKICSREFSSYTSWYVHERNYDKLHFACDICPRFFHKKSDLEVHHRVKHLKDCVYSCKICSREFSSYIALNVHERDYDERHFACDNCTKFFYKKSDLEVHRRVKHLKDCVYSCKVCTREFSSYMAWNKHVHNYVYPHFACDKCPRIFNKKSDLEEHQVRHLKDFSCKVCGKIYSALRGLQSHQIKHSGIHLNCAVCNKTFNSGEDLEIHSLGQCENKSSTYAARTNTRKKKFTCDICGKTSAAKYTMENHILKDHLNINDYVCGLCGRAFAIKRFLYSHHKSKHANVGLHRCNFCGKSFENARSLKHHMTGHSKSFECDMCGKSFGLKQSLRNHVLQHVYLLDYKCDACGKGFASLGKLSTHKQRIATRKYPCVECDKTFCSKQDATRHVSQVHPGPSDPILFPCSSCSKVFLLKEEHLKHLKTHGFFCASCDLICLDGASFKAHVLDVHGERNNNCRTCGQRCRSKEQLTIHEKTHVKSPFRCAICYSSFTTKNGLEHHFAKYHVIMEHNCDQCLDKH